MKAAVSKTVMGHWPIESSNLSLSAPFGTGPAAASQPMKKGTPGIPRSWFHVPAENRVVERAQDLFATAVKTEFAPVLRRAGMKGSGSDYSLPNNTHFVFLGFQKSQFSSSGDVAFTINLKVVPRATWERAREARPDYPTKPSPSTTYGTFEWHERIGRLLPGGEDKWWHFVAGQDNGATVAEVVDVLTRVAVPALRSQLRTDEA